MGMADFFVLGLIAAAVLCAVVYIVRRKAQCGGGCAGCPYKSGCHREGK